MAPPSDCPDHAASLQDGPAQPLGGQVVRSSKSEETSAIGPSANAAHTAKSDEPQPPKQTLFGTALHIFYPKGQICQG